MSHGGRRPNAGRPKVNENDACVAVIRRRAKLIEDFMKSRELEDDYKALRMLFIRKTREKVGSKAASLVEDYAEAENTAEQAYNFLEDRPKQLSAEDALQVLLRVDLSKHQYETLRKLVNAAANFKNLIPCYNRVRENKKAHQPIIPQEAYSERKAEVKMQNLLAHTTTRAVVSNNKAILQALEKRKGRIECEFTITWGCDGASGQTQFQQQHEVAENKGKTDDSLFAAMINPIVLKTTNGTILWQNPTPQSHLYVAPILLEYQKESKEYVMRVKADIDSQIAALRPVEIDIGNGKKLRVNFRMMCTLIDGKIFCFFMNKATTSCPVCTADFRHLKEYSRHVNTPIFDPVYVALLYGLQVLHAWINFGNHLFHLAWKLAARAAKAAAKEDKPKITAKELGEIGRNAWRRRDDEIREEFKRNDIHLTQTLTGNMARLLFGEKCDLTARILGVDRHLIERFRIILICVNTTRYFLKTAEFKAYCAETRELYLELYSFFPLTPTIHKILEHATEAQQALQLPHGVVSEGAGEATHRIRKLIRRFRARKMSRQKNLMDVFNRCFHLSDIVLSDKYSKCIEKFRNARRRRVARKSSCEDMELPQAAKDLLDTNNDEPPPSNPPRAVQNRSRPLQDTTNRRQNLPLALETAENPSESEEEADGETSGQSETEMSDDYLTDYEDVFMDE